MEITRISGQITSSEKNICKCVYIPNLHFKFFLEEKIFRRFFPNLDYLKFTKFHLAMSNEFVLSSETLFLWLCFQPRIQSTLVNVGEEGGEGQTSSNISTTEHPVSQRLLCKFKFVRCGPVEKTQSALSVTMAD